MGIFPVHVENPINCTTNIALKNGAISDKSLLNEEMIIIVRFYNGRYVVRFKHVFQKIQPEVLRIIDLVFLAAGGWTRRVAAAAYTRSALTLSTSHIIHILNKNARL